MQKLLKLNNFAKSGINSDLMPWDLPGDYLTEINNARIIRGKINPFGGSTTWVDLPDGFVPGYILNVGSVSGDFWIVPGLDAVYAYDSLNFHNISSIESSDYQDISSPAEDYWTGCLLTKVPVLTNPSWYPEFWPSQGSSIKLELLPWSPGVTWKDVDERCRIIRSHKQFLFALDLLSGSSEIPDGVRWSTPADVNSVPENWDPLDITSTAGFVNLGGDGGSIVDGLSLRDAFVVYRESSISVFDYVGGQFVWQIRHLSSHTGLIAPDALVEVRGNHYFIGDGDILVNDGNSMKSLLHNRLRKRFTSNIDTDSFINSYAVKNNIASEIWFCVPESGHTYPNIAYIYNWEDDTWAIREIPEAPFANYGSQSAPLLSWDTIDSTWSKAIGSWSQRQLNPMSDTIIAATKPDGEDNGTLEILDITATGADSTFNTIIERTDFALEGLNVVTTMTRVYPHIRGNGSCFIQLGSQDYPGADIRWKPPVEFFPAKDRKVDIRTTGELHCFRIYTNDVVDYWELSGLDIEYVIAGLR